MSDQNKVNVDMEKCSERVKLLVMSICESEGITPSEATAKLMNQLAGFTPPPAESALEVPQAA